MLDYMASDFVRRTGLFATQEATVVKSLVEFVLIKLIVSPVTNLLE